MRRMGKLGLILMILSVTACAPVVYDANYGEPARDTYAYVNFDQPAYYNETAYRPIEVTLYADNSYMGVYFQPMHLVIYDGQYVEIPVRDRRGRDAKIYAHYHQNNLHFDTDRNDHGINGSSRFNYDNRWENGHKYSNINAGKDYDLTGLQMQIRNAPVVSEHRENRLPDNNDNRSNRAVENANKASMKQTVPATSRDNQTHKVAESRNSRSSERQATVPTDKTVKKEEKRQDNSLIYNNNSTKKQSRSGETTAKRPEIVKKTIINEQSHQVSAKSAKFMGKENTVIRTPVQKFNVKGNLNNERNITEPQKINSVAKVNKNKKEIEAATTTQQKEGPRPQDKRFAEKHEVDDVTSQDNANEEGQQGWSKAMDNYRDKSKKSNQVLNEAD